MTIVAVLAYEEQNTALVAVLMLFLATFQATLGTYSWVYLGQVACDEGLAIATFFLWFFTLILSICTQWMFDTFESWGTFTIFAVCSYCAAIFFFIMLRETKGQSRD